MISVETIPRKTLDPIILYRSSFSAPDKYLTTAVCVIPYRIMSIRAAADTYKTHSPNNSIGKLLASNAKLANPNKAIVMLRVNDRKFASLLNFCTRVANGKHSIIY